MGGESVMTWLLICVPLKMYYSESFPIWGYIKCMHALSRARLAEPAWGVIWFLHETQCCLFNCKECQLNKFSLA